MKVQEVILRAISKQITWWHAAEILSLSPRQLRRLYHRLRCWVAHASRPSREAWGFSFP